MPARRPVNGTACTLAADASCFYVPPSTPCDPDELTCKDGTWSGEHVQF